MFTNSKTLENGKPGAVPLLTVVGDRGRMEGKFDIADSIQVECEVGGEMTVGGKLVIGGKGSGSATVPAGDAVVKGSDPGNMIATGNAEIPGAGRGPGHLTTASPGTSEGGFFNGN